MMQDPYRQDARSATPEDLTAAVEQGPVSHDLGRQLIVEETWDTDRVLGFLASDNRRAFDEQRRRVFGDDFANELSAEAANRQFGVDGYLTFDGPVNGHRAVEMNRQATLRRYREQTAARADLSGLEVLGASLLGGATDPVMLPTWFIGGGSAALRALRVAPAATRAGGIVRGAAVGMIDGLTGGVAAEALNAGARLSTGEDYSGGDALRNILFGGVLGGTVGGTVGGLTPPRPRGPIADLIAAQAETRGENAATAIRIAQLESGLDPAARNPRSSASGLFQFIDDTWKSFGAGDRMSAADSARAGVRLLARNRETLSQALRRPPAEWELYLAHQQGAGGATELLRDPARPAVDALRAAGVRNPARALTLNGGSADMTAGQFADLWRGRFGASGPTLEAVTPQRPPSVLRDLSDNERVGGFVESVEAMASDRPVDLGPLLARTAADSLDEASAVPGVRGRWLETDVAVARTGEEIPVRFAVVEMADLKTSHTDDLSPDPTYPAALQPRDRTRPGSVAENFQMERDLNPRLLMRDKAASGGAPIVSPDGLVESGNGRVIVLRRSAATGTGAWTRYAKQLAEDGIDVTGFERPVLVRMRTEAMTGVQRAEMAATLNQSQTAAYSPVEQAQADARRLDTDTLAMIEGDDPFAASNRPFQRAWLSTIGAGDMGALSDAAGAINPAGRERVRASLIQAAYDDPLLTAALFDKADSEMVAVGNALADAAPAWARMRARAPAHMDATANLTSAVHLLRHARKAGEATDQVLHRLLASEGLLDGAAVSPETELFLRMMFRDQGLSKPRGAERLAWALKAYAHDAAEAQPGANLFGEIDNAQTLAERVNARLNGAEGAGQNGLAYAGGSEPQWSTREADTAVLDLRPAEPVGNGPDRGGQRPDDGDGSAGPGGQDARLEADLAARQERVDALIAADPELKALVDDTEALARAAGVDLSPVDKSSDPSTVAEAIRAAAFCLATEFGA